MKTYDKNLDRKFLSAQGVSIKQYQPWQFGLFYPDLPGKFVWYPQNGTLMYTYEGPMGTLVNTKLGEFFDTEEVYNLLMERVTE